MRFLFKAVIIIITVVIAFAIYLEIGNRRFNSSLPKPLNKSINSYDKEDLTSNATTDSLDSSVTESEVPLEQEIVTDIDTENTDKEDTAIETTTDGNYDSELDIFEQYLEDEFDLSEDGIEDTISVQKHMDQDDYLSHTSNGRPDSIYSMSRAKQEAELERRRQRLIEDFGDTPEVRLIIKHFHSRVIPRGTSVKFQGEEGVEILRALSVLWPIESNVSTYQSLKLMQESGWHR